jgi:catechol 2,3-dioxygenase-like lactoylglutathione lyase family enzyme
MLSHIMVGTDDVEKAKAFYDKVLGTLGISPGSVDRHLDGRLRVRYPTPSGMFAVTQPIEGKAIPANGCTIGFAASSPEQVKAWHDAGVAAGGKSIENPPGVREAAAGKALSRLSGDLEGNKICALHRMWVIRVSLTARPLLPICSNHRTCEADLSGLFCADIVAKVENRTMPKSRESGFLDASAAAIRLSADAKVRGHLCTKQ